MLQVIFRDRWQVLRHLISTMSDSGISLIGACALASEESAHLLLTDLKSRETQVRTVVKYLESSLKCKVTNNCEQDAMNVPDTLLAEMIRFSFAMSLRKHWVPYGKQSAECLQLLDKRYFTTHLARNKNTINIPAITELSVVGVRFNPNSGKDVVINANLRLSLGIAKLFPLMEQFEAHSSLCHVFPKLTKARLSDRNDEEVRKELVPETLQKFWKVMHGYELEIDVFKAPIVVQIGATKLSYPRRLVDRQVKPMKEDMNM